MEFNLFLPQMRLSFDDLVARARAAEAAGFVGITGMDHLVPPLAETKPMYEAFITSTWIAARTSTLRIGSLVLCDSFRHPAVLAREAVSLDHASGGRFDLGIGWGSVPTEFETFGVGSVEAKERVQRFRETLEVVTALWAGETVDYAGQFHSLQAARQEPTPLTRIPIVIGGTGPKTLALVREYADWWNGDVRALARLDELRSQVGDARVSLQHVVAYVPPGESREEIEGLAMRRFGGMRPAVGDGPELVDHFGQLAERGVERVYTWFTDFARPESLAAFGEEVIAPLRASAR